MRNPLDDWRKKIQGFTNVSPAFLGPSRKNNKDHQNFVKVKVFSASRKKTS